MVFILGIAVIVVATNFVYKTARDIGRNALLWAAGTVCVGIVLQWFIPLILRIFIWIGYGFLGDADSFDQRTRLDELMIAVSVGCVGLNGVAMWYIIKMVSRTPDEPRIGAPPPPPKFN